MWCHILCSKKFCIKKKEGSPLAVGIMKKELLQQRRPILAGTRS